MFFKLKKRKRLFEKFEIEVLKETILTHFSMPQLRHVRKVLSHLKSSILLELSVFKRNLSHITKSDLLCSFYLYSFIYK